MHQARIHALYNSFTFGTWDQIQSLEYGRQALTTDSQRYNVYDGLLCGISLTGSIPFPLYNRYDVCQLDFSSKTAFLEISFPNQAFPEVAIVFDPSLCIDAMHIAFGGDGRRWREVTWSSSTVAHCHFRNGKRMGENSQGDGFQDQF